MPDLVNIEDFEDINEETMADIANIEGEAIKFGNKAIKVSELNKIFPNTHREFLIQKMKIVEWHYFNNNYNMISNIYICFRCILRFLNSLYTPNSLLGIEEYVKSQ